MANQMTELVFIIDRSGSMSGKEKATIQGFNGILDDYNSLNRKANAACIALNSRPCLGAAPLPLYQQLGLEEHDVATFRCVKSAE